MAGSEGQIDLKGDGRIVLYKRDGLKHPKWQVRIRVPNAAGYKIVTSKTDDLKEAERFAHDLYEKTYMHVQAGGSIKSKTFKQVFDEWRSALATMGPTRQGGSWNETVNRVESYALPYFGAKNIDALKPADFARFWIWRKTNFVKVSPSNGTLRRERMCLLPMFKFAREHGYIAELPEIEPPKVASRRRPTFTPDEWRTIYTKARSWVEEGREKATWRDRFVTQQYLLILANTGMRVGELRRLRWSDLRTVTTNDSTHLIGNVRGKTGAREVAFQEGANVHVTRLYDLRMEETKGEPGKDGLVICHRDGSAIGSMKRSFNSLLSYADVPVERDGMARTIYSLRHFYATQRLSNEVSPFLLARQMGTSVEMLEKFYGHTVTSSLAAKITKGRKKTNTKRKEAGGYPFE